MFFCIIKFYGVTSLISPPLLVFTPGAGKPQRSGDIANKLGKAVEQVAPLRAQLISKGMIYSPAHGDIAFTVPLFEEFLIREIPIFSATDTY